MTANTAEITLDSAAVLAKAVQRAGKALGLTATQVGEIVGRDRGSIRRGIEPKSKPGELSLVLVRLYRSLYALMGGDPEAIRHWMRTPNRHTGGIPAEQILTVAGLFRVVEYLDAIRGRA